MVFSPLPLHNSNSGNNKKRYLKTIKKPRGPKVSVMHICTQIMSHAIKNFQELPESQRADAVSSMVYEASARIRDPVYGCAGAICHLQKQVSELQAQLAKAQAELVTMESQQRNLIALICMEMAQSQEQVLQQQQQQQQFMDTSCFLDDNSIGSAWEPLWTWSREIKARLLRF